jgi:phage tail sheath protein FI
MPVVPALSYPGVYVQEIPSGVRTITGVATSITAFIGRALRGPTDEPVSINSYGDFERIFGGLWVESTLGYAVRDFYLNGGARAIIVRLYHPSPIETAQAEDAANETAAEAAGNNAADAAAAVKIKADTFKEEPQKSAAKGVADAAAAAAIGANASVDDVKKAATKAAEKAVPIIAARLDAKGLGFEAKYPGTWGNNLRARIDHNVKSALSDKTQAAAEEKILFNLSIRDGSTGQNELFRNVSTQAWHKREVGKVLENESRLVSGTGVVPSGDRPPKHDDPAPGNGSIWDDNKADPAKPYSSKVAGDGQVADDGDNLNANDFTGPGKEVNKQGLYALEDADLFNLLCIPPYLSDANVNTELMGPAAAYCEKRRAMLLVDPPASWNSKAKARDDVANIGTNSKNSALFFPRLREPNPLRDNQVEDFVPCGAIAGIMARTDSTRGVWKAPAGLDATLIGVPDLSVSLTDLENGELNPLGINCLRTMPAAGRIVWGSRTLQGDDRLASEWKYIPVRRTALYIEESLYRGTQWVVFEPNDEPLWAQIRLNVGAFMQNMFRQGAFQGTSPKDAYFVKCDKETTIQNDINLGIVNIMVGFAPLKPAEFVVIYLQQIAGQIQA